ncbi:hypothetical protein LINGRAHAP2_LOCUS16690 [Linum grandiflorum]
MMMKFSRRRSSTLSHQLLLLVILTVAVLCFMSTSAAAKGGSRGGGGSRSSSPVLRGAVVGGAVGGAGPDLTLEIRVSDRRRHSKPPYDAPTHPASTVSPIHIALADHPQQATPTPPSPSATSDPFSQPYPSPITLNTSQPNPKHNPSPKTHLHPPPRSGASTFRMSEPSGPATEAIQRHLDALQLDEDEEETTQFDPDSGLQELCGRISPHHSWEG